MPHGNSGLQQLILVEKHILKWPAPPKSVTLNIFCATSTCLVPWRHLNLKILIRSSSSPASPTFPLLLLGDINPYLNLKCTQLLEPGISVHSQPQHKHGQYPEAS